MALFTIGLAVGFMGTIIVTTVREKRRNEVRVVAKSPSTSTLKPTSSLEPDRNQNPYFAKK